MILLKFLVFLLSGEGTALTRRSKLWLAAVCRHYALQAKYFLHPRPRRSFPQGISRRESRYLTRLCGKYFLRLALLWIKKLDTENFKLQRTAMKFGANIIWLPVYLFVGSPCLRGQPLKFKAFAVLFCSRAELAERSIFGAVGGIRCRI